MTFQDREKRRLAAYAKDTWGVDGHVLPHGLASETLHESIRSDALAYFAQHGIKWWIGTWDKRTRDMMALPTGHLTSSQVACINHLDPARVDQDVAEQIIANIDPGLSAFRLDHGYVDYEWIDLENYLGETGARVRGANVTSLDAVMGGKEGGRRVLVVIEWKYLERNPEHGIAKSKSGTDRVAIYRRLLEHPDSPIVVDDIEWLFHEPFDQLMRQTLLAWQMVSHGEFGAHSWLHVLVVPESNLAFRTSVKGAPNLPGPFVGDKWRTVLKDPQRFRLMTPSQLVSGIDETGPYGDWRRWIRLRYLT